jgi:hypothetical protein
MEKIMSKTIETSRELTVDELDAVSGGAQQECTDVFACALLAIWGAARSPSGGGLVHEPTHAK